MRHLEGVISAVRTRAENTPASRDRSVDLLRAWAICMVVLGHWLVTSIGYSDGRLTGENALEVLDWSHPITWLFQVMPVFFLVGGFSNAASLTSYLRSHTGYTGWLLHRTGRLLRPATALLITVPAAAIVAVTLGADTGTVGRAAWLVAMPLWFLAAYLAMVGLAPITYALHRRFGWAVPIVLVGAVAACDVVRIGLEVPYVGDATYLLGWLVIHQAGYFWFDGRLPDDRRVGAGVALVGLSALLMLTLAGPYEVVMVGGNTNPPSLALLALATTQLGVILVLRDRMNRWMDRPRAWAAVVAVNAVILTVFLWHMSAALLAALAGYPTGVLTQPDIHSAAWLAWRVPWLATCAVVLFLLVAVFARIEMRPLPAQRDLAQGWESTLVWVLLAAVLGGGLLGIALGGSGYHGPGALPPLSVIVYLVSAAALRAMRLRTSSP